jgi:hypothetical protein
MQSIKVLLTRRDDNDGIDSVQVSLLVSLLVLVIVGLLLVGLLFLLRNMRRAKRQQAELPLYEKRQSGHRRLTITATPYGQGRESIVVYQEKQVLMANSTRPQSGRVVVVRVGEHGEGLEPLQENLPPYQRDASDRFDSLDLDRIGGLKEKDDKYYS